MPNLYYDLPIDIKEIIDEKVHKLKFAEVMKEIKKPYYFTAVHHTCVTQLNKVNKQKIETKEDLAVLIGNIEMIKNKVERFVDEQWDFQVETVGNGRKETFSRSYFRYNTVEKVRIKFDTFKNYFQYLENTTIDKQWNKYKRNNEIKFDIVFELKYGRKICRVYIKNGIVNDWGLTGYKTEYKGK